jgi:hypothetical protein
MGKLCHQQSQIYRSKQTFGAEFGASFAIVGKPRIFWQQAFQQDK